MNAMIDRTTMYRLVLYILLAWLGFGVVFAALGWLAFSPLALVVSVVVLVAICWAANTILAAIFNVPANIESATLTALILALIIEPPKAAVDLQFLGWAALLAMSSKYVLALWNKHIFNPAAIAVVITAFTLKEAASWWVGAPSMVLVVLVGGVLLVRKVRQEAMVGMFLLAALVAVSVASALTHANVGTQVERLVVESPLLFFAAVMLTEPLTAPPTQQLKLLYAALVGILFIPQVHIGGLYSTPELALVVGNIFAYAVSPKRKLVLRLKKKTRIGSDIVNFTFQPTQALAYAPGQYMEWTLGHGSPDQRGNRRYFTLASSPTERVLHLGVRFSREGSTYKRALLAMSNKTTILAGQVAGDFTLPKDPSQKLVFIAGGIGITPFRSMLKYLIDRRERRDIVVVYVNSRPEDIVYRDVLNEAQTTLGIPTVYTITNPAAVPPNWTGYVGRIDSSLLAKAIPDFRERTFYLSGPPEMVRGYEQALRSLHVSRRRIKQDFFAGL